MLARYFILFLFGTTLWAIDFREVVLRERETQPTESTFTVTFEKTDNTPFNLFPGDYVELKYPRHWESRIYSIYALSNDRHLLTILVSISPHRAIHPHVSEELFDAVIGQQTCQIRELSTGLWQKIMDNPDDPLVIIAAGLAVVRGTELIKALNNAQQSRQIHFIHSTRNGKEISEQSFLNGLKFYVQYKTGDGIERMHQGTPAFLEQFLFPNAIYLVSGHDRTKRKLGSFESEIKAWLINQAMVPEGNIVLSTWAKQ